MKDNKAGFIFKKTAIFLFARDLSHLVMTTLNLCAVLTPKQNKTKNCINKVGQIQFHLNCGTYSPHFSLSYNTTIKIMQSY